MSLADLQSAFQAAILAPDPAPADVLARLAPNAREPIETRFTLYHNAYRLRLIEALGVSYERLHLLMGEGFAHLAGAYVAAHASPYRNLRWYGGDLPDFLDETTPWSSEPALAQLAALERNLNHAFDAPDAPVLSLEDLAARDPAGWPELVFTPHPGARRLGVTHDVLAQWEALCRDGAAPPATALPEPGALLTWRQDGQAMVRALGPEEEMMWIEMARGLTFGQQCTLLAVRDPEGAEARAATYLGGWIQTGLLAALPPQ